MLYTREVFKKGRSSRFKLGNSNLSNHCMVENNGPTSLGLYAGQEQAWSPVVYPPSPNMKPWSYLKSNNKCDVQRPPREKPERCIRKSQIRAHKTQKAVELISVGNILLIKSWVTMPLFV